MRLSPALPALIRRLGLGTRQIDAPLLIDAALLITYIVVRVSDRSLLLAIWFGVALILAVRWPASGLGVGVALALFPEQLHFGMTPSITIIGASAVGLAVDFAVHRESRPLTMRSVATVVAGAGTLSIATLVALIHSLHRFSPTIGVALALRWTGFAAGLGVLVLCLRTATLGSRRPLVLGIAGLSIALVVALLDTIAPDLLPSSGLKWMLSAAESSRATGPFASANRLGTIAAVVAIVGAVQFATCDLRRRWFWAALGVLGVVVLASTFSRGALLGLTAAGAVLIATRSRRLAAVYVGVIVIAAVVAIPMLVGARLSASGGSVTELSENDAGRIDAWLAGVRMIIAQPVFGHGFGAFRVLGERFGATDGLVTAHNEFIGLWAEAGIVAAAGSVAIVIGVVVASLQRRADSWGLTALGVIVVFTIASSFNVQTSFLAVTGPVWLIVAFGIARSGPRPRVDSDTGLADPVRT